MDTACDVQRAAKMTEFEMRLAKSLANCSFLPGSSHKRFCRNMADIARLSPEKELSLRQRHYMELMAWRYRRQLPADVIPHNKPLDLPRPIKPPKEPKAVVAKPDPEPDLFNGSP
jgi:hypothetical protein